MYDKRMLQGDLAGSNGETNLTFKRVARGSASLLSSHGRGIAPQDALKKDSRGLLPLWSPRGLSRM